MLFPEPDGPNSATTSPGPSEKLTPRRAATGESELYVFVADPGSGVDSSPRTGAAYDRRIGNVLVHYGGGDRRVLAHVKAAVAAFMR